MYLQQDQQLTGSKPRRAWRLLRAPLIGLLLAWGVVKGVDRWRISRLPREERALLAHEHCLRAQEICDEACQRLGVGPINLPREVMGEMVDEYSRALEIDATNAEALEGRAYWRWFRSEGAAALRDYDELLRLDPRNALAFYQRGRLHCDLGEHAAAIADYTRSLELIPARPGQATLSARARCRRETGDWRGALADLEADGGTDTLAIADCRQALGQHAEALKAYDAYLRNSRSFEVRYRRGVSRFATGDRPGALEDFAGSCENDGPARTAAQSFISQHPGDPMSGVLQEALRPQPESPR